MQFDFSFRDTNELSDDKTLEFKIERHHGLRPVDYDFNDIPENMDVDYEYDKNSQISFRNEPFQKYENFNISPNLIKQSVYSDSEMEDEWIEYTNFDMDNMERQTVDFILRKLKDPDLPLDYERPWDICLGKEEFDCDPKIICDLWNATVHMYWYKRDLLGSEAEEWYWDRWRYVSPKSSSRNFHIKV